jgi:hypothetical protein
LCVFWYVSLNSLTQTVSGFRLRMFVVTRHTILNVLTSKGNSVKMLSFGREWGL